MVFWQSQRNGWVPPSSVLTLVRHRLCDVDSLWHQLFFNLFLCWHCYRCPLPPPSSFACLLSISEAYSLFRYAIDTMNVKNAPILFESFHFKSFTFLSFLFFHKKVYKVCLVIKSQFEISIKNKRRKIKPVKRENSNALKLKSQIEDWLDFMF